MSTEIQLNTVRLPASQLPIQGIEQDSLSAALRKFDNTSITAVDPQGVYISTNETGRKEARKIMEIAPKIVNGCHIGFSGWHNFDIMVIRESSRAIICDYNPENAYFLHHALEIVRKCCDRFSFVDEISSYVERVKKSESTDRVAFQVNFCEDGFYMNANSPQDEIKLELQKKGSWLQNDKSYERIRKLALEDKIVLITEDIKATSVFKEMKALLHSQDIQIDSLYVSNIMDYMFGKDSQKSFLESIEALSDAETLIIASSKKDLLDQRVIQPKELTSMRWFDLNFPACSS